MERTLADSPEIMRERRVHLDTPFDPALRTTEVYAPCCGRRCPADCVLDVRGVPGTTVQGGGHQAARDHDWLCDGCRDRMIREPTNDWTASQLCAACGGAAVTVRSLRILETRAAMERAAFAAGQTVDLATIEALAMQEVDRATV